MMANTLVDVAGPSAEQAPGHDVSMTSRQWRLAVAAELVFGGGSRVAVPGHPQPLPRRIRQLDAGHRALAPLHPGRDAPRSQHGALLPAAAGVGRLRPRRDRAAQPVGAVGRGRVVGGDPAGARAVRAPRGSARRTAARGGPALRPVRPGRARVLAGAPPRERVLLLLRPGHPPGRPSVPVLLDGLHRRHRLGRLHQLLGRPRSPGAGAVARLLAAGKDPVAPGAGVGRRAGCPPGPPRPADRVDRQRRGELGIGVLGRPPVHPDPGRRSARRVGSPRPGCGRRGRGDRRAGATAPGRRGGVRPAMAGCASPRAGSSCPWPPW